MPMNQSSISAFTSELSAPAPMHDQYGSFSSLPNNSTDASSTMLRSACAVPSVRWKEVLKLMPTLLIVDWESRASPSLTMAVRFFDTTPGTSARLRVSATATSSPSTLIWRLFEPPTLSAVPIDTPVSDWRRSTLSSSCVIEPRTS